MQARTMTPRAGRSCDMSGEARRKKLQRDRDRALGWREVIVKVADDQVQAVRDFVACLPPPAPPSDARQMDLIDRIEAELEGSMEPSPKPREAENQLGL